MRESRIPLWESGFHAFLASRLLNAGDKVRLLDAERKLVMTLVPEAPGVCK